ncbi:hypothetical protein PUR22_21305 [Mycolicibacterium porcinum]|uniref:DUF4760 domain-containing protein n=1 Tax=Mycolicibacterium porcinum TaxID=39693 RepID=UPI0031F72B67
MAILIWAAAVLLSVLVGSAAVLAMLAPEPNWSEITMALATVVMALATVGLAVAAFFALGSIREARKALDEARIARNAVQMTEWSRRWDQKNLRQLRRKVREYATHDPDGVPYPAAGPLGLRDSILRLQRDNNPEFYELLVDANFMEDLAILVQRGGLDFEVVNMSLGYNFPYRWCLWKPTADAFRAADGEEAIYKEFENLALRIAAVNPTSVKWDEEGNILWRGFRGAD